MKYFLYRKLYELYIRIFVNLDDKANEDLNGKIDVKFAI